MCSEAHTIVCSYDDHTEGEDWDQPCLYCSCTDGQEEYKYNRRDQKSPGLDYAAKKVALNSTKSNCNCTGMVRRSTSPIEDEI